MAQNYKRRITLFPDSIQKIENSFKKFKDFDLSEKTDSDTFNKSTINTITPLKEKKLDPSLLDTPIIEKKVLRKISIYSPLSFNENSNYKDSSITSEGKSFSSYRENISTKKVSNFNNIIEEINDDIPNFKTCFGKIKKLICENNKKAENMIEFYDKDNKLYKFPLFYDKNIFVEDNLLKDHEIKNIHDDESSDEEKIKNDFEICINQLDKAMHYYANYPYSTTKNVNIGK